MRILPLFSLLIISLFFLACGKDEDVDAANRQEIEQYIEDHNYDAQMTASGLYYFITEEGDGDHPTANSSVTVDYHGYLTDGQVFDSSILRGEPATFSLTQVIPGWREGVQLLSRGGSGTLIIPSKLGYGSTPPLGLPADAVLIFDVKLIDFE